MSAQDSQARNMSRVVNRKEFHVAACGLAILHQSDTMRTHQTDVAIIGGGIIGLATAYRLTERFPDKRITLLEKEAELAFHQSGRNSGVLHSGIYYKPGSLKATNCREGKKAIVTFCEKQGIAYDVCGKVIVAVEETELPNLERIYKRGQANGIPCEMIDRARLAELEPHAAGIQAIHVPEAGIVDFVGVCRRLGEIICEADGEIHFHATVTRIQQHSQRVIVQSTAGDVEAGCVVNCTGLYSDRVTKLSGLKPEAKIVPFRGEYYELIPEMEHLCHNLIYPVPDPRFPFLGVHFTRMALGGVECGPNAVLAFAREGYKKNRYQSQRLIRVVGVSRFSADGHAALENGVGRDLAVPQQSRFRKSPQAVDARNRKRTSQLGPIRSAGTGSFSGREFGRRFSHSGKRASRQRIECTLTGCHRCIEHRPAGGRQSRHTIVIEIINHVALSAATSREQWENKCERVKGYKSERV